MSVCIKNFAPAIIRLLFYNLAELVCHSVLSRVCTVDQKQQMRRRRKQFLQLWKAGMWSELCLNSALLDQSHLNNFLENNVPSESGTFWPFLKQRGLAILGFVVQDVKRGKSPLGERERCFRGSILSVYWNSSNTIKCILNHPKQRQINAELKIVIEKIAKKEGP